MRRWLRALALCCALAGGGLAGAAQADTITLQQAEFALAPDGPWQAVALPDSWGLRGAARPAQGWYRLRWDLPAPATTGSADAAPVPVWALRAERLGIHHRLWLNGQLLHDTLGKSAYGRSQVAPFLLHLPPALLRGGDNHIVLQVSGGLRAGLSALRLGESALIEREHEMFVRVSADLPQQINLAAAGACLFALLLWWHRRSEKAMGWFGLLGLILSLRNHAFYETTSALPPALSNALFFTAQVGTVVLLGVFAMSLTQRRPLAYRALLLGGAALMIGASIVASVAGGDAIDRVRALAYPLLGLLALPALWLIGQRVRHMRGGELATLLATLVAVVLAGAHDYLFQQGRLAITDNWWLPYATPLMVMAFAVLMVGRVVAAMTQVEVLNRTLEQRVRERTQALAAANAAKSRFLAAASHDLRQPVVTIGLLVSLLRDQVATPALRATVARVDDAVAAMESLLAGLLDLSRLDSGSLRVRPQPLALQPLFDAVAAHEAEGARRKGLVLRLRPTALAVRADPVLLEQILRNLVSNAVRYTDTGGVLVVARRRGNDLVRMQVWDSGRGIAPEHQALVFEEFVQLDNPQRERAAGLGLGLAIVRRSAALLGAPLTLRSQLGRGSCFSLDLPFDATQAAAAPAPPAAQAWLAGMQLLLVEDDGDVRAALVSRLTAWGATVSAHDGPRALRVALDALAPGERQFDLLITDLRLPGGTGLDVVALARQRLGALPALVVTGNTAPADIAALAASGLPVLHKPFRADELRRAIAAALRAAD